MKYKPSIWIGAKRNRRGEDFYWTDGAVLSVNDNIWDANQPHGQHENCVTMNQPSAGVYEYKASIKHCTSSYPAVCDLPLTSTNLV